MSSSSTRDCLLLVPVLEALDGQDEHREPQGPQQRGQAGEECERGHTDGAPYLSLILVPVQTTPVKMW